MTDSEAQDVEVLVGALPEGISLESNGALRATDATRYELLGTVKATLDSADAVNFLGLWFYPYVESEAWRKALCYWQVPLSWLTLTNWALYSPLAYPCKVSFFHGNSAEAVEDRKARLLGSLRRTTKALGGNLLVVTAIGNTKLIDTRSNTTVAETDATEASGVAIRKR